MYVTAAEWDELVPAFREAAARQDVAVIQEVIERLIGPEKAALLEGEVWGIRIVENLLAERVERLA